MNCVFRPLISKQYNMCPINLSLCFLVYLCIHEDTEDDTLLIGLKYNSNYSLSIISLFGAVRVV